MGSIVHLLIGCALATASTAAVNQTVGLGTDVAGFFIYHPDDLKHRETSPSDWMHTDFACGREFNNGTLIAFSTGGDGGYDLRLTDGDLTPRERPLAGNSYRFRYRVQHGRVYVDEGNYLPYEESTRRKEKIPESQGVAMPNGDYEVRSSRSAGPMTTTAGEWANACPTTSCSSARARSSRESRSSARSLRTSKA